MTPTRGKLSSHCIYGADADLIMLGLATHDPYFYIIRERLDIPDQKKGNQNNVEENEEIVIEEEPKNSSNFVVQFTFVKLFIVREFLGSITKDIQNLHGALDIENVIDDFVLLCFLVGNDFLPHLPGLDIRMGGIDILLTLYKKTMPKMNGYLTNNCEVVLANLEFFLKGLGRVEHELLRKVEDIQYNNVAL